jgi:hypothetical protein
MLRHFAKQAPAFLRRLEIELIVASERYNLAMQVEGALAEHFLERELVPQPRLALDVLDKPLVSCHRTRSSVLVAAI